jgi:hypothetical protein
MRRSGAGKLGRMDDLADVVRRGPEEYCFAVEGQGGVALLHPVDQLVRDIVGLQDITTLPRTPRMNRALSDLPNQFLVSISALRIRS